MSIKNLIVESAYRGTLPDKQVDSMLSHYTCPNCDQEFDPKEAEIEYPDVYLECDSCFYGLADDFGNDLLELWMAKNADRMENQDE